MQNTIDELFTLPHDNNDTAIRRDTRFDFQVQDLTARFILWGFLLSQVSLVIAIFWSLGRA